MKFIKYFLLFFLFISCNKNNPVTTNNVDSPKYLGLPNTSREYESTSWTYEAGSTIPYVKVPDSLYNKLSFDSISIKQGLSSFLKREYVLIQKDTSYNKLKYYDPTTIYCQERMITKEYINLETELDYVLKGTKIPVFTPASATSGEILAENENEVFSQFDDSTKYYMLKKPLSIGLEWVRRKLQYKNEKGNYETFQLLCKVVSKENISIKAGNFSAYKVEVTNYWVDLNSKSIKQFEYYVPNIGLVLSEYDSNLYSTLLFSDGTSKSKYYREKNRYELVSYKMITN